MKKYYYKAKDGTVLVVMECGCCVDFSNYPANPQDIDGWISGGDLIYESSPEKLKELVDKFYPESKEWIENCTIEEWNLDKIYPQLMDEVNYDLLILKLKADHQHLIDEYIWVKKEILKVAMNIIGGKDHPNTVKEKLFSLL